MDTRKSQESLPLSKTAVTVRDYYNQNADLVERSKKRNARYYRELEKMIRSIVLPGQKVLDLGCGTGDLLSALNVSEGVGIDLSEEVIGIARKKNAAPNLRYIVGDAQNRALLLSLNTCFDAVILRNVITEMHDIHAVLEAVHEVCHPRTRIIIFSYSRVWQIPLQIADNLGIKVKNPVNNWFSDDMVREMIHLAGFEVVRSINHQIFPFNLGPVSSWINRYIGNLPVINLFTLMFGIIARPLQKDACSKIPKTTIVIPCRNEAGHIESLAGRIPDLGVNTEVIWVEGNSTDNTAEKIQEVISLHPEKDWHFLKQPGKGKGDAVRCAFAHAQGDILMILDADITVPPEDLPKFVNLLTSGKAEFVNGCRLVYPMDDKSMRFLNLLGNKFFAALFSYLLGQQVRDTLCGTKALWQDDYERIRNNRSYFGEFDPFGDFDLLFGASRLNLKIVDMPIRYGERTYGSTNISRFSDGALLLRMCLFAARKLKFI
ncbi:MAG: glycosyltransferase [Anaerolineaceae bacterium]|nr:glycosyltransferase [Anaerolineaceae bacterium]